MARNISRIIYQLRERKEQFILCSKENNKSFSEPAKFYDDCSNVHIINYNRTSKMTSTPKQILVFHLNIFNKVAWIFIMCISITVTCEK